MEISGIVEEGCEVHNSVPVEQSHEALFIALSYLPLFELLAMSQVCKSLRDAVNKDILPWLDIVVQSPLCWLISDDILVKITSKANGRLRNLALVNCVKVTDGGLQQVVEKNPLLTKLYVPACTGLTPEGIIKAVKTLTKHSHNLISLKINGIYNIKKDHLETLHSLLKPNVKQEEQMLKPMFYHKHNRFLTFEHEEPARPVDTDICQKCDEVRMVFDCPREDCERKRQKGHRECKGCYFCIDRCVECGRCFQSEEVEEAACLGNLCMDCWLQLPKCFFCNTAFCNRHVDQNFCFWGSSGFLCGVCDEKLIQSSKLEQG